MIYNDGNINYCNSALKALLTLVVFKYSYLKLLISEGMDEGILKNIS